MQLKMCTLRIHGGTCEATNVAPTAENVRRALEIALGGVRCSADLPHTWALTPTPFSQHGDSKATPTAAQVATAMRTAGIIDFVLVHPS